MGVFWSISEYTPGGAARPSTKLGIAAWKACGKLCKTCLQQKALQKAKAARGNPGRPCANV
jgi:hypothetical protein